MYAAIYCRKSVNTQRGESMQSQLAHCRAYLAVHRSQENAANAWIYQDEGYSGAAMQRPAMQRLLADIRSHLISCVVCYRLDRISRSVADFTALMNEFSRYRVDFLCASEEFDTAKPMGRAMLYIASVFSQLERETLAERVRDNMYTLAADGRWLGGTPPYGFRILRSPPPHPQSRLMPAPDEQAVLQRIFSHYRKYHDLQLLADSLSDCRNRLGNPFSVRYLRAILRNPVYAAADSDAAAYLNEIGADTSFDSSPTDGILLYGKRPNHGNAAPLAAIGGQPALLTGNEWVSWQKILATKPKLQHSDTAFLRGILSCDICGSAMMPKQRTNRAGQFDYICKGKRQKQRCSCKNLVGIAADAAVWDTLCAELHLPETVRNACFSDRRAVLVLVVQQLTWDGTSLHLMLRCIPNAADFRRCWQFQEFSSQDAWENSEQRVF